MDSRSKVRRLLNKKGWNGGEVGRLLLMSLIQDIEQAQNPVKKPLFSQEEFEQIERTITKDIDIQVYNRYRGIYDAIVKSFTLGQVMYQQFYNGFNGLFLELTIAQSAEEAKKADQNTPLIMTEKQYKELVEEATAERRAVNDDYYGIFFHCLMQFIEKEAITKKEYPAVWKLLSAYKKKKAGGQEALKLYNDTYGLGYHELPSGIRSDKVTDEEWRNAETKENKICNGLENFTEGYPVFIQKICQRVDSIEEVARELATKRLAEWHAYEEPPEDLTVYDLLEIYSEAYYTSGEGKDALALLKKDLPELVKVINSYIEDTILKAEAVKKIDKDKTLLSWGLLADLGVIGYKELVTFDDDSSPDEILNSVKRYCSNTTANMIARQRSLFGGIAIIQNPKDCQLDEKGYYKEPASPLSYMLMLNASAHDDKAEEKLAYKIESLIAPSLSTIYCFNEILKIIEQVYNIPELFLKVGTDTEELEERIMSYNNLLYLFYTGLYGDGEELEKKKANMNRLFKPIGYEKLKPTPEAIAHVAEELKALSISGDYKDLCSFDGFISELKTFGRGAK